MISSVVSPVALFGRRIIAICLLVSVNILSIELFSLFFTQMSSYVFRDCLPGRFDAGQLLRPTMCPSESLPLSSVRSGYACCLLPSVAIVLK